MKDDLLAVIKVRLRRWFASKGNSYLAGWEAAWENYEVVLGSVVAPDAVIMQAFAAISCEPREWPPSPGEIYQRIVEAASPTPSAEMAWMEALRRSELAARTAPSHRLIDDAASALGGYDALSFEWSQGRPMVVRSQYLTAYTNLLAAWQADVRRELMLPRTRQRRELLPDKPVAALTPWSAPALVPAIAPPVSVRRERPCGAPMPAEVKQKLSEMGLSLENMIKPMPQSGDKR